MKIISKIKTYFENKNKKQEYVVVAQLTHTIHWTDMGNDKTYYCYILKENCFGNRQLECYGRNEYSTKYDNKLYNTILLPWKNGYNVVEYIPSFQDIKNGKTPYKWK